MHYYFKYWIINDLKELSTEDLLMHNLAKQIKNSALHYVIHFWKELQIIRRQPQRCFVSNLSATGFFALLYASGAFATPVPVATYNFNSTLAAEEAGAPALSAIDPLGSNHFRTENVFGTSRTVYRFDGNRTPVNQQAGLVLNANSLLDADEAYSVEMIMRFDLNSSSWENLFGVSNRSSDNAFYVAPSGQLQVWPNNLGTNIVTQNDWHHITMTNDGAGTVTGFLDGVFQSFSTSTTSMDFGAYSFANPNRLIHFFADNVQGGGQGEFADGSVALIRLYDIALTSDEVGNLPSPSVPEPGVVLLLITGLFGFTFGWRKRPQLY